MILVNERVAAELESLGLVRERDFLVSPDMPDDETGGIE